jgi:hypothetical protein
MSEYQMKSLNLVENENYQNVSTSNFIFDESRVIKHSLSIDGAKIEDMKT